MVDDVLEIIKDQGSIIKGKKDSRNPINYNGFYVFLSFDLVNSTQFKSIENSWPQVINYFYDEIEITINKNKMNVDDIFSIWKYVGDEVLFYYKIKKIDDLIQIPSLAYECIRIVTAKIHKKFEETRGLVFIKGTFWGADIKELPTDNTFKKNQSYLIQKKPQNIYEDSQNTVIYDFLGPDIDSGFRLASKGAYKNQLVISAEILYLLIRMTKTSELFTPKYEFSKFFKIIELVELKGIWHGRKYPVIWFRTDWEKDIFDYDEDFENSDSYLFFKRNYLIDGPGSSIGTNFEIEDYLHLIFKQTGQVEKIESFIQSIKDSIDNQQLKGTTQLSIQSPVEFHVVLMLFNRENKLFLRKRSLKRSNPNKYDFGCTNLLNNQTIETCLLNHYKNLFKEPVEIEIIKEKNNGPSLISLYEFTRANHDLINGAIFVGRITNEHFTPITPDPEGDEYSFYDVPDLLSGTNGISFFDYGLENIQSAYDKIVN